MVTQEVEVEAERVVKHPAKFSDEVLVAVAKMLPPPHDRDPYFILDPFAGTGKGVDFLATLGYQAWGVELEEEWAEMSVSKRVWVGNALDLGTFGEECWDAVVTSPCYGNRMADHHNAKDASKRITYKFALGRDLSEGNAGEMQWGDGKAGDGYRDFHRDAWVQVRNVLKPGRLFVLNVSNHIRRGVEQKVSEWHRETLRELGFKLREVVEVETKRMKRGANNDARVRCEYVCKFTAPE